MSAQDKATDLAQALLDAGKTSDEYIVPLFNNNGDMVDEEVHVFVVKAKKNSRQRMVKLSKRLEEVAFFGSGGKCSVCNGTGRVY